ncbi:MAG: putative porin, partial [Candidatus Margulisbacteria bacterium]|nr:putative porin [Candidatus Margulisiibacteriota bacterium]
MEKKVQKILVAGALTLFSMAFAAPGWFVNTDVNQDFRYRLQEDKSDNYVNNAPRYRERLRYRLGLTARVSDEFTVGTRLATGDLESTKSRTDTFGNSNAFGAAAINLDQAYVSYSPKWIPGAAGVFKLTGGKFGLSTGVYTVTTIA